MSKEKKLKLADKLFVRISNPGPDEFFDTNATIEESAPPEDGVVEVGEYKLVRKYKVRGRVVVEGVS